MMTTAPQVADAEHGSSTGKANPAGDVLVFAGNDPAHRELLSAAIADCGVRSRQVWEVLALQQLVASNECAVALLTMPSDVFAGAAALETIRGLRQNGFAIIACAERSQSWTTEQRCLPLIAGAIDLLDPSRMTFSAELRALLTHTL
ncbi:MAG TPA: hypothetical protein VIT23_13155, partial [Terrimicrobiaceae bacterium]